MDILRSSVRLPSDILVELGELTGHAWNSWLLEPIICDAIRGYMRPQAPVTPESTSTSPEASYQWKQLYLPEGTRLRAAFGGVPYFAVVKGSAIQFGERTVTPSGFANLQGSGNRNAWKAVWLRFPGNEQWVLADVCRAKQKIAIARLFGAADGMNDANEAALPQPPKSAGKKKPAALPAHQAQAPRGGIQPPAGATSKVSAASAGNDRGKRSQRRQQRAAAQRRSD